MIWNNISIVNGFVFTYKNKPCHYLLMDHEARHIYSLIRDKVFSLEKAFSMFTGKDTSKIKDIDLILERISVKENL
jgi:hypothetical protein